MAIGFHLDNDDFPAPTLSNPLRPPMKYRVFAVVKPGTPRRQFMTNLQFRYFIGAHPELDLPDTGRILVFNDLHPFGMPISWTRIDGGMTRDEMIDSNLQGERVVHG